MSARLRSGRIPPALCALLAAALLAAPLASSASPVAPAADSPAPRLEKRQSAYQAFWYNKCAPVARFLNNHGVPSRLLWENKSPLPPEGCCNYDASDATTVRKITCNQGILETITWGPDELVGPLSDYGFVDQGVTDAALGKPLHGWTSVDLSGNTRLTGTFPRWLSRAGTLQAVNLSRTGLSGQLPRLDIQLPSLRSLDISNTKLQGYLPAMPANLTECKTAPNPGVCRFPVSDWSAAAPSCGNGLVTCTGQAPSGAVPGWPQPLQPMGYGTPAGDQVTAAQCNQLRSWLIFHGYDAKALWDEGANCCQGGKSISLCCSNGWINHVHNLATQGLTGDINLPEGGLNLLRGMDYFDVAKNKLSGGFPKFLTTMPNLNNIDLTNNRLTGPIPELAQLPQLYSLKIAGNGFTGPLPLLVRNAYKRDDGSWCCGPSTFQECRIQSEENRVCWAYDVGFYDENCASSNPDIVPCGLDGTQLPPPVPARPPVSEEPKCVRSCEDLGHYVPARLLSMDPLKIACNGPNSTACSWYEDANCTKLAPGEAAPLQGGGVACTQNTLGWCGTAATVLLAGAPVDQGCPAAGPWICMRMCDLKGNSVKVRALGDPKNGGTVQCQGPDRTKCSWYEGGGCSKLAAGEPQPDPRGEMGYRCEQLSSGWCKSARDVAIAGVQANSSCPGLETVTPGPNPTETAVPPKTTALPQSQPSGASRATVAVRAMLVAVVFAVASM
ncbi:hypothetical protein DFJ74DRAFT_773930 [Hyaloraphidium curvatum]|nr:hypothetical protein DFJ74DRAFT_773930 [Hyaloraphidium curvatum]